MNPEYDVIASHKYCTDNFESISLSRYCACIYCKQSFSKEAVIDWIETKTEKTAVCPFCGIDSVIGDSTNAPITDNGFIETMHQHWFS